MKNNTSPDGARTCPIIGCKERTQETSALFKSLRAATRLAHHSIDHHVLLAPLVRADLQRAHYVNLLRAFSWIYKSLDPAFDEALKHLCPGAKFLPSNRSGWLAEDLAYFSVDNEFSLPSLDWPPINTVAELVGRLYAIEGSTLGGQVIARQLEISIGVGPKSGGQMFHGHGPETLDHWQAFMEFAGSQCSEADTLAACFAANQMFEKLAELLAVWFECSRRTEA